MPLAAKLQFTTALESAATTLEADLKAALTAKDGRTSDQVAADLTAAWKKATKAAVEAGLGEVDTYVQATLTSWANTHFHNATAPGAPTTPSLSPLV